MNQIPKQHHYHVFFFWASCWNHCLAVLDLGAGVGQPFNCLIVQNRQVMQSMGRSMDWTLEDTTDGMSSAPHSHTTKEAMSHFYKQERKCPTPVRRRLSRTQALLGRAILEGWVPVSGMKMRSLVRLSIHSTFHWLSAHRAARVVR